MEKNLKYLLDSISNFHDCEDINYEFFDKVEGELLPNSTVEIWWKDRDLPDIGYAFALPHQKSDEWDLSIHLPAIDNSDGIGIGEEVFEHIYSIVALKRVKKVISKGGIKV